MADPLIRGWPDRWANLWYRWTYCRHHGHFYSAFGGEIDDYCLNCGKDRKVR